MRPLGGKPRAAAEALIIPAGALAVSLILFGIFVAFAGANPLAGYRTIYRGAFGSWFSWQNTLQRAAPLMRRAERGQHERRRPLLVFLAEHAATGGAAHADRALHGAARPGRAHCDRRRGRTRNRRGG